MVYSKNISARKCTKLRGWKKSADSKGYDKSYKNYFIALEAMLKVFFFFKSMLLERKNGPSRLIQIFTPINTI
jgi:hypothetical protein